MRLAENVFVIETSGGHTPEQPVPATSPLDPVAGDDPLAVPLTEPALAEPDAPGAPAAPVLPDVPEERPTVAPEPAPLPALLPSVVLGILELAVLSFAPQAAASSAAAQRNSVDRCHELMSVRVPSLPKGPLGPRRGQAPGAHVAGARANLGTLAHEHPCGFSGLRLE